MFVGKPYIMGQTAEFIAQHMDISRREMDEVALRSQNNAERANDDGSFADEIVPMEIPRRKKDPLVFDRDEHFRPGLTMEQLEKLPPAFVPKIGKVTAGNSSGINDGSAAMVIMSADKARELGLKPLARMSPPAAEPATRRSWASPRCRLSKPAGAPQYGHRRFRTGGSERSLRRPVHRLRTGSEPGPGNHQRQRIGHRPGPPGGRHRLPNHGQPAVRHEKPR
jgi:hypothetical protein